MNGIGSGNSNSFGTSYGSNSSSSSNQSDLDPSLVESFINLVQLILVKLKQLNNSITTTTPKEEATTPNNLNENKEGEDTDINQQVINAFFITRKNSNRSNINNNSNNNILKELPSSPSSSSSPSAIVYPEPKEDYILFLSLVDHLNGEDLLARFARDAIISIMELNSPRVQRYIVKEYGFCDQLVSRTE